MIQYEDKFTIHDFLSLANHLIVGLGPLFCKCTQIYSSSYMVHTVQCLLKTTMEKCVTTIVTTYVCYCVIRVERVGKNQFLLLIVEVKVMW